MASTECLGDPVANAQLVGKMDEAEQAFSSLDLDSFQSAMDAALFSIPCLSDPLSPQAAAQFHRMQGLRQFVAAEEEAASSSFHAARVAQPDYSFPESLVPPGHAIRDLYEQAAAKSEPTPGPYPETGKLWIDGRSAGPRDTQAPALLQIIDHDVVLSTTYLLPGDALPFEPAPLSLFMRSGPSQGAPKLNEALSRVHQPRFFVGLGLGAAAIGGWALASQSAATYQQAHPTWGEPELRRQERLTNGLTLGAGVMGLASVGMMGSAVMVMRW